MDNKKISIKSDKKYDFELAMKIAVGDYKTLGYLISNNTFILYHTLSDKTEKLPYPMNVEEITNLVWGWIEKTKPIEKEPDHDGHNEIGFHIFSDDWGQTCNDYRAFVSIKPIWAMYGK